MSAELPSDETAKDEGAPHEEFATDAGFIDEEGAQDPILADASDAIIIRSRQFRSSLTLFLRQSYAASNARASGAIAFGRTPRCVASVRSKWSTSAGISDRRSRRGGTRIRMTSKRYSKS